MKYETRVILVVLLSIVVLVGGLCWWVHEHPCDMIRPCTQSIQLPQYNPTTKTTIMTSHCVEYGPLQQRDSDRCAKRGGHN